MKVVVGSDHAAFKYIDTVIKELENMGIFCLKCGAVAEGVSMDYPVVAQEAVSEILKGNADYGVLMCGTGIGISIAANKFDGIRAALCHNDYTAVMAKEHNNANILCMGGAVLNAEQIKSIIHTFFTAKWSDGERHARRLDQISEIECNGQIS